MSVVLKFFALLVFSYDLSKLLQLLFSCLVLKCKICPTCPLEVSLYSSVQTRVSQIRFLCQLHLAFLCYCLPNNCRIILQVPGLVNVDFADVHAVMKDAGSSLLGIGTATGKLRACSFLFLI